MANTSFTIVNYFDRLQRKAHEIDEKLAQLSNIWKTPHLLIGGYAERTDETDIYLENLMESIRNTRVNIIPVIASFPDEVFFT